MIITKITSGLGNQLFQYFNSYAISKKYEKDIYIDISSFDKDIQRSFLLKHFDLNYKVREKCLFDYFKFIKIKDIQKGFQEINLKKNKSYILEGYWQSYLYFDHIKEDIQKKIFQYRNLNEIFFIEKDFKFVSVHVRRGDYVSNIKINQKFKLCDLNYYKNAVKRLKVLEPSKKLYFLIFSDDYTFIKNNFQFIKNKTLIKGDKNDPLKDLFLMMNCNHNIISNSTFSWWGAWLNKNPNKIVVTPEQWFWKEKNNFFLKDLLPNEWIKI